MRLATVDGRRVRGYRSGRKSARETPEAVSTAITRPAGTPLVRHLWMACVETPTDFERARMPPDFLMASSTADMVHSQPQVETMVNRPLLETVNRGFHTWDMSPLGRTIVDRLNELKQNQAWLAEEVGVSEQAVSKWLNTGKISRANAIKTAASLDISVDQLLNQIQKSKEDERWNSFPLALKQKVLALVDELAEPKGETAFNQGESNAKNHRIRSARGGR